MLQLVTPAEMQALDAYMIHEQRIPGILLMEHAAMGVAEAALGILPERQTIGILCGGGNNGGDGLAVLRLLHMRGIKAWAALLTTPENLHGDARLQYDMAQQCGLPVHIVTGNDAVDALPLYDCGLLIDAMFGTGLSRPVSGHYQRAICRMNDSGRPVLSVDIPSGIDGKTGAVLGEAVRAYCTVTFQHKKLGHMLFPGRAYTGKLRIVRIGMAEPGTYAAEEWEEADIRAQLPPRPLDSHKGCNGRALLCAGSSNYTGAAILSASAALRCGCGLLHAAVPQSIHAAFTSACPSAICSPVGKYGHWDMEAAQQAVLKLPKMDAAAIGPGMGNGDGVPYILEVMLRANLPLVIDADGLNTLAKHTSLFSLLREDVLLTPHPGEMARLMGAEVDDIVQNPVHYAQKATVEFGCTVLLKGATTVIASNKRLCLNATGNSGLAKGGSGDVLTGILLGLLAQKTPVYEAACIAAYLLGSSAEKALELLGTRMLLPTDVVDAITHSKD